ncbi:MAG: hypothetical protein M1840_007009 [Geoglossum simile]|nr:MAG: hypothetical protein M1840_007009 [Geoglossum simile]
MYEEKLRPTKQLAKLTQDSLSLSDTRLRSTVPLTLMKTMPQIYTMVRASAARHMNSFPDMDDISTNTAFHITVRSLPSGKARYENRMDDFLTLGYALSYRLEGMMVATNYKYFLRLNYHDCIFCNVEAWTYLTPFMSPKRRAILALPASRESVEAVVLMGDTNQLQPVVVSSYDNEFGPQLERSMQSRLMDAEYPSCTLRIQYRMLPEIAGWLNRTFYDGKLADNHSLGLARPPIFAAFGAAEKVSLLG